MLDYLIPNASNDAPHQAETLVCRSKFISSVAHTPNSESAKIFLDSIRRRYPDATHHCWAYVVGAPGDTGHAACNDDGEPSGTAGRPMLTVLLHCGIGEITVVVTRYFGGIKLGTGGLVHAYQDAVKEVLLDLPTRQRAEMTSFTVMTSYSVAEKIRRILPSHQADIISENYAEKVSLAIRMPTKAYKECIKAIIDASKGNVQIAQTIQTNS